MPATTLSRRFGLNPHPSTLRTVVVATIWVALVVPRAAHAQTASTAPTSVFILKPEALPPEHSTLASAVFQQRRSLVKPTAIGAVVGAAVAAGATYAAAAKYGNNEGGTFCARCFVQWSAFTVPVGAAAGAAIGWGIGRARRSVTAVPLFSPATTGLVLVARF